jgi:TolB protein
LIGSELSDGGREAFTMPCDLRRDAKPRTFDLNRRRLLAAAGSWPLFVALSLETRFAAGAEGSWRGRLVFTSYGKTAIVNADDTGLRYFEFDKPGQATWQVGAAFPDGRRLVLLSMEPRRDGPGRPFEEYYTQTPTHLWIYDLETRSIEEIVHKERLAPFLTPALLIGEDRPPSGSWTPTGAIPGSSPAGSTTGVSTIRDGSDRAGRGRVR